MRFLSERGSAGVASSALDSEKADKQECGFIWNREADNPQHHQKKDYEISA
jgi:hypothetical protein